MGWLFLNSGLVGALNFSVFGWLLGGILLLTLIHNRNEIREFFIFQRKIRKFAAGIPRYPGIPILGNALQFRDTDKTIFTLTRMSQEIKAGTFTFWLGPVMKVVVTDPRDYEIILSSAKAAEKDHVYQLMQPLVINGLINGGGSLYRSHKKLVFPMINGASCLTEHIKQFNIQSKKMVTKMEKQAGCGEFDVGDFIVPCVADIVNETVFGITGNAQDGVGNIMMEANEPLLHDMYTRMANVWLWPDIIYHNTALGKKYLKTTAEIHDFLNSLVTKKKEQYGDMVRKGVDQMDIADKPVLDQLMVHSLKTNAWSDQDFRSELFTLFIASHDTIVGVSSFAALMLAMHPQVQQKAREEVLRVVGHRDITEEDTINMKWMDCVVKETVRLFPVGPLLARQMTGDLKLATCTLPKGASVYILPFATHRSPEYWKEPNKFMPERFLPENSKDRHTWAYVPFSGGVRSCPGSKYGTIALKIILGQMVRNYQLSTTSNFEELNIHAHISARSADGYPVSIKKLNH